MRENNNNNISFNLILSYICTIIKAFIYSAVFIGIFILLGGWLIVCMECVIFYKRAPGMQGVFIDFISEFNPDLWGNVKNVCVLISVIGIIIYKILELRIYYNIGTEDIYGVINDDEENIIENDGISDVNDKKGRKRKKSKKSKKNKKDRSNDTNYSVLFLKDLAEDYILMSNHSMKPIKKFKNFIISSIIIFVVIFICGITYEGVYAIKHGLTEKKVEIKSEIVMDLMETLQPDKYEYWDDISKYGDNAGNGLVRCEFISYSKYGEIYEKVNLKKEGDYENVWFMTVSCDLDGSRKYNEELLLKILNTELEKIDEAGVLPDVFELPIELPEELKGIQVEDLDKLAEDDDQDNRISGCIYRSEDEAIVVRIYRSYYQKEYGMVVNYGAPSTLGLE